MLKAKAGGGVVTPGPGPGTTFGTALPARIPQSTGTHYYVAAAGGNDAANGLTPGTAWATIQHAFNTVPLNGSIINLLAGTYSGGFDIATWARAGSPANPVTLQSYPGDPVVITRRLMITGGSYLRVRGIEIVGAHDGVKANGGAHHCELDGLRVHGCVNQGLVFGAAGDVASDFQVWNSRVYQNGDGSQPNQQHGIYTANMLRAVLANLLVYDNDFGLGLQLYPNLRDSIVTHCTIDEHLLAGPIVLGGEGGDIVTGNRIHGCVLTRSSIGNGWPAVNPTGAGTFSGNQGFDSLGWQVATPAFPDRAGMTFTNCNDASVDPLYVNLAARDYRLRSGSPAINLAASRPEYVPALDIDGNPRATADAGCYAA